MAVFTKVPPMFNGLRLTVTPSQISVFRNRKINLHLNYNTENPGGSRRGGERVVVLEAGLMGGIELGKKASKAIEKFIN